MSHRCRGPRKDPYYPPQRILELDTCDRCGKVAYDGRRAAESEIRRLDRDDRRRHMRRTRLHAYQCPHGNGWHIAHALSQGRRTGAVPSAA